MRIALRLVAVFIGVAVLLTALWVVSLGVVGFRQLLRSGGIGCATAAGWSVTFLVGPFAAIQLWRLKRSGRIGAAVLFLAAVAYYGLGLALWRSSEASLAMISVRIALNLAGLILVASPAARRVCST